MYLKSLISSIFISIILVFILPIASIPAKSTPTYHHPNETNYKNQYPINLNQFSQLFSNQLIFDHIDGSLNILSKDISNHFQQLIIQSQLTNQHHKQDFDFELLKGQLQAAIVSYVEDSLPDIWNAKSIELIDKIYIMDYIEKIANRYCSRNMMDECIKNHSYDIIYDLDNHIHHQLRTIVNDVIREDLPSLFKITQQYVNSVLTHFGPTPSVASTSTKSIDLNFLHHRLQYNLNLYLQSLQSQSHSSFQNFVSTCRL